MSEENDISKNLWPDLGQHHTKKRSPIAIIREQASQLASKTQGIVTAKLILDSGPATGGDGDVDHVFLLMCPPLGGYFVNLFYVRTRLTSLYPVHLWSSFLAEPESGFSWKIEDEPALEETLRRAFTHKKTIAAIESMVAHALSQPVKSTTSPGALSADF